MKPRISVVTPVRNGKGHIVRCLNSIHGQGVPVQHIVQDGMSDDGTSELLAQHPAAHTIQTYREKDAGIYDAVARGMARAEGEILAWLNADDYYTPWTFSTVQWVFENHPDVDWITGLPAFVNGRLGVGRMGAFAPIYLQMLIRKGQYRNGRLGFLMQESMFWRRRLWERVRGGEVIRGYRLAGDFHLWRSFAEYAPLRTVACVLGVFTVSDQQASSRNRGAYVQEAGSTSQSVEAHAFGKIMNRLVALLGARRLIRPPLF